MDNTIKTDQVYFPVSVRYQRDGSVTLADPYRLPQKNAPPPDAWGYDSLSVSHESAKNAFNSSASSYPIKAYERQAKLAEQSPPTSLISLFV